MKIINRLIIALFLNCLFCCSQKTKEKSLDFGSPELIKETIFKLPWGSKLMIITKYPTYCWDELNNDNKVYTDAILNIETDLVKRFSQSNIETNVEYKNLNLIQKAIEKESVLDFSYMKTNITYDKKSILIKKRNNIQVKLLSLKNERGNYLNLYTLKNKDTIDVLNIYSSESIDYYENSDYNKYDSTYYSKLIKSKIINEGDFFSGYVEKLCYIDKDFNIWVSYFVFRDEGNSLSICYVTNEKYKLDFNDGLFVKNNRNTIIVGTEVYAQVDTYLNIRSTPDSKGAIVGKAYPKDGLKVLEVLEGWLKVSLNGTEGYVSSDFVR